MHGVKARHTVSQVYCSHHRVPQRLRSHDLLSIAAWPPIARCIHARRIATLAYIGGPVRVQAGVTACVSRQHEVSWVRHLAYMLPFTLGLENNLR